MAVNTTTYIPLTNSGGTYAIDLSSALDVYYITGTPVTLSSPFGITFTNASTNIGRQIRVVFNNIDSSSFQFAINGVICPPDLSKSVLKSYATINVDAGGAILVVYGNTLQSTGATATIKGSLLVQHSVGLDRLATATSADVIVYNGSSEAAAVAMTGDIGIDNAGITAIAVGVIVNADVSASAAIARTKLANGTASHVIIDDGSGVMSSEVQLAPVRGGLGTDASASTGFVKFSAGTASIAALTSVITVPISWETGEQCNNRIKIPFACTITDVYAVVTKALANTDAGTIVLKNAAGTSTTLSAPLSFAASSALETALDVTATANNTTSANDIIYVVSSKVTPGGKALVSIIYTRTS